MRVIAKKTLKEFWFLHPDSEQPLKAWHNEVIDSKWKNPGDIKLKFNSASIISNKRIVFNIKGNTYRLVTDIEYNLGIVFIVWIGTHNEYDKINIKDIKYGKTH